MWYDIINDFKKSNKQFLDFKFDLHVAIYIINILKEKIKFTITKNKTKESLTISYSDEEKHKKLSYDDFFFGGKLIATMNYYLKKKLFLKNLMILKIKS